MQKQVSVLRQWLSYPLWAGTGQRITQQHFPTRQNVEKHDAR